ncbi:MAG: hypothetical protein A2W23_01810 [Planctomycetes bacterium RBG_16_43_13]|nr:MAG: hypothetical protein A2W23_01810 [Planctomycetes bacterium RBG_16_43_13]
MRQNTEYRGQRTKTSGFTLLEVMIASVILAAVILAAVSAYETGMRAYSTASSITDAEGSLRVAIDNVVAELWETDPAYVWVNSFTDVDFATPQEAITFLSPRNATGNFIIAAGQPSWQSVCVYCPYAYTDVTGVVRRQLRRYEWTGVPAQYTQTGFVLTFNITTTQITLPNGVTLDRRVGRVVLNNTSDLSVSGSYPLRLGITAYANVPGNTVPITLTTDVAGRNKN